MNRRRFGMPALAMAAMIIGAVTMAYPYVYMVGSSFKTRREFAEDRQSVIPPRYQVGQLLAHARGEASALDWPGADWPVSPKFALPNSVCDGTPLHWGDAHDPLHSRW